MEFKSFFLVTVIFMYLAVSGNALICYQCHSVNDGYCFDPEANYVISIDCQAATGTEYDYVCFTILGTTGNVPIASRGCQQKALIDSFCAGATAIANVTCVGCEEDLCNG